MQNPRVLADSEGWAMLMSLSLGYFGRFRDFINQGWMKLSMLQESIRADVLTPLITISELDLDRDDGDLESTEAKVGHITAVLQLPVWILAGLDLQTLGKCPFFWHLLHVASLAGHFWQGRLL